MLIAYPELDTIRVAVRLPVFQSRFERTFGAFCTFRTERAFGTRSIK